MFLVINHIIVAINDSMLLQQQLLGKTQLKFCKKDSAFCEKLVIKFFGRSQQKKGSRKNPENFHPFFHILYEICMSFVDYFTMFKESEKNLLNINRFSNNLNLLQNNFCITKS